MRLPGAIRGWRRALAAISGLILVAGGVVAVAGLTSAGDAEDELVAAGDRLDAATRAVARQQARLEDAIDAVEDATEALLAATGDHADATGSLDEARTELADAQRALSNGEVTLESTVRAIEAYYEEVGDAAQRARAVVALGDTLVALRSMQLDAAAARDFASVHRFEAQIDYLIQHANAGLIDFGSVVQAMSAPGLDPTSGANLDMPIFLAPSGVTIDVPTGPAEVEATILDVIPCRLAGNDGCDYQVVITFTESNTLRANVTRIGVRWIEPSRNAWWISRGGEFVDVDLVIPADGTATYTVSIFADSESRHRRILGGTVRIRYNGVDDEGNRFRGDMTSRLERPPPETPI